MDNITVADVLKELDISRSYLYKILDEEKINIARNEMGRYEWNEAAITVLKNFLNKEQYCTMDKNEVLLNNLGLKRIYINNRRYLGNKYSLTDFIRGVVEENCTGVNIVTDIFSGTGSVANAFSDKMLLTNDMLYSNYIVNFAWFGAGKYDAEKIIRIIYDYNRIKTSDDNYMRQHFSDTFFSPDDCSKIGCIREDIESRYKQGEVNFKEYAILLTSLLYAMDRIANTVGHYDAYRKNAAFERELVLGVPLPEKNLNRNNRCFHEDANTLIGRIKCDLLYLDPPYNSRQYCDAYHLLENVARWEKPRVFGVAKKMDRTGLKSEYCLQSAATAFEDLIKRADVKYILLSYNNMSNKGNARSNAKISDADIMRVLSSKGEVTVFEEDYKSFSTGKSAIKNNKERLFLCVVKQGKKSGRRENISCPFNYTGGKFRILPQIQPLMQEKSVFLDVFAGGGSVGINSLSSRVIFNDINSQLIGMMNYIRALDAEELLKKLDALIADYDLSNTSVYGYDYYGCNSSQGLANYNKEKFFRLREDYNRQAIKGEVDYARLYLLIVYGFNNQLRFNCREEFNLPVGKRDFNAKMRCKLRAFSQRLKEKDVCFFNCDFRQIDLRDMERDTFIYCDPPYLIMDAVYNENGLWSERAEKDLLAWLDTANQQGLVFALSNVLYSKNRKNEILGQWIEERGYFVHSLERSYANSSYHRKEREMGSAEILVTNYQV